MRRFFASGAALALAFSAIVGSAHAQEFPKGTAAMSPGIADDRTSWAVFLSVVTPVPASAGWPAGTLTYETWATDNDTFGPSAPHWPSPSSPPTIRFQPSALGLHGPSGLKAMSVPGDTDNAGIPPSVSCQKPGNAAAGDFPTPASTPPAPPANCAAEEVRRNLATFNYIAGVSPAPLPLYTQAQMATSAKSGPPVSFPSSGQKGSLTGASIEVKVDWIPVDTVVTWLTKVGVKNVDTAYVMANYFTTTQGPTVYAMLSMHVNLKDRPNWLWSTFEHQMNPGRCDTMGCYDMFGMEGKLRSIPPNKAQNGIYPVCTGKSLELQNMFKEAGIGTSSVWNNYCLKSTQADFVYVSGTLPPEAKADAIRPGAPLALLSGDSVVERVVANVPIANSSCITCHSYAAFTDTGTIRGNKSGTTTKCNPGLINGSGPVGDHKADLIAGQKQYDFVWGMINAAPVEQPCSP